MDDEITPISIDNDGAIEYKAGWRYSDKINCGMELFELMKRWCDEGEDGINYENDKEFLDRWDKIYRKYINVLKEK